MLISNLIYFILKITLLPFVTYKYLSENKISILLYHEPKPEIFEKHMAYVSKRYNFISLDQAVSAIEKKDFGSLPKYPLVVTFDDGIKSNYLLKDTIKKYDIKPTIYVCAEIVNTHRKYWFKEKNVDIKKLKHLQHDERTLVLKKSDFDFHSEHKAEMRQSLSLSEIKELISVGVSFESHTSFHPILTTCNDDHVRNEIFNSKLVLEKLIGKPVNHFSYPNGDYSSREEKLVIQAGYKSARTTDVGLNDVNTSLTKLKMFGCSDDAPLNKLICQLSGIPLCLNYLLQGSFNGKKKIIKAM